jgi:TRAP-type C4-dicarboxylate transport system permease small subunit
MPKVNEKISGVGGVVLSYIEKLFFKVSMFSAAFMMIFVSADALGRYILNMPITGQYEITEDYLMVALVFLSLSHTYVMGGHVRVTLLLRFIPSSLKFVLNTLFNLAAAVFFALLTYVTFGVFIEAVKLGELSTNILRYPMAPAYFLVPLGSAILCIRLLQDTFLYLLGKESIMQREEG